MADLWPSDIVARTVKYLAILLSLVCAFSAAAQSGRTNQALSAIHYDLAECVFRQYMAPDSKIVFCLAYGTNHSPLPRDFIARFKARAPIVRGDPDAITVVSNRTVLDKVTRREAIGLVIREIRVAGDKAEVQVKCFASSTANLTRFYLVREKGRWGVKERKMEYVSDAF